ncbi:uncharacterized protein TM35_000201900 [Trypanosoma theileri]|uniref:MutL C-terminal dimerisation domain-containing protein n=1 Tax=Trypanosoma theileri TaxID=67003 RepID=A0A1X0NT62_9TRYP|nr:uncharacterized protein TM35_000201900 [Trypanosoma theileri]ORC87781.1 hypothetical protein TM35_000201900 [Trypanosoma theileri]
MWEIKGAMGDVSVSSTPSAIRNDRVAAIQPMRREETKKIRAAHHIPSFTVAVEGTYQFIRSLVIGEITRAVRVLAIPTTSNFIVELTSEYQSSHLYKNVDYYRSFTEMEEWLSDLTVLSQEVRLRVAVETSLERIDSKGDYISLFPKRSDILFKERWLHTDLAQMESTKTSLHEKIATKIRERMCEEKTHEGQRQQRQLPLFINLRCEVHNLFFCIPVRQRSITGEGQSSYRLRAEWQALVISSYRMAVEFIIAPLYLSNSSTADGRASLYLRVSDNYNNYYKNEKKAVVDIIDVLHVQIPSDDSEMISKVHYPIKRDQKEIQKDIDSLSISTVYRVLLSLFPHLRLLGKSLGSIKNSTSLRLREVIVKRNSFAVVFVCPLWDSHNENKCLGRSYNCTNPLAVSVNKITGACHVVDESHRVYRHISSLSNTLYPLLIFVSNTLLEGSDTILGKLFLAAKQGYHNESRSILKETTFTDTKENIRVVDELRTATKSLGDHSTPTKTSLRVSSLARRLSLADAVKSKKSSHVVSVSHVKRTPFYPLKWITQKCNTSTLSQVRSKMKLVLKPSHIAIRGYEIPFVWTGLDSLNRIGGTTCCPFRKEHLITQWDRKFFLLYLENASKQENNNNNNNSLSEVSSPSSVVLPVTSSRLPHTLYLADQHAIHERLRLEYFLTTAESYVMQDSTSVTFPVKIPVDIRQDVTNYEEILMRWGWRFAHGSKEITEGIECKSKKLPIYSNANNYCVTITQWPHLVVEGHQLFLDNIDFLRMALEEIVTTLSPSRKVIGNSKSAHNGSDCDGQNAGGHIVPSPILQFLITRSCRGAIMFGDKVSFAEAEKLVEGLQAVVQYSLCSHGRPAFAVLQKRAN